jgi:hypothetical protein
MSFEAPFNELAPTRTPAPIEREALARAGAGSQVFQSFFEESLFCHFCRWLDAKPLQKSAGTRLSWSIFQSMAAVTRRCIVRKVMFLCLKISFSATALQLLSLLFLM